MSLRIFLYFINWNDSFYLPFLKTHYGSFCERMVMYDNYSTDNSVSLAKSLGMEVRTFGVAGELNDAEYIKVKDNCWKEAIGYADFVIVCDADEFLYHKHLLAKLVKYKKEGVTLPRTQGYEMVSDRLPEENMLEVTSGFKNKKYSKNIIFDPDHIQRINYNYGSHNNRPEGKIRRSWKKLSVLHYRNIGGFERMWHRHEEYRLRLSQFNKEMNFGKEYLLDKEEKHRNWQKMSRKSYDIFK